MEKWQLNKYVRLVLIAGMILSVSVISIGLAMYAISPGSDPEISLSPSDIVNGIIKGNPIAVIDLGILFLIATPLMRVITALVFYVLDKETKMVGVSVLILIVIGIAVVLGAS
jgi:uncharacterized membrane protein